MMAAYIVNDLRELVETPAVSGYEQALGSFCSSLMAFYYRGFFVLRHQIRQDVYDLFCLTQRRTNGRVTKSA
jgi:hypothetical protein